MQVILTGTTSVETAAQHTSPSFSCTSKISAHNLPINMQRHEETLLYVIDADSLFGSTYKDSVFHRYTMHIYRNKNI